MTHTKGLKELGLGFFGEDKVEGGILMLTPTIELEVIEKRKPDSCRRCTAK